VDREGWEGLKPAARGSGGRVDRWAMVRLSTTTSFPELWSSDTPPATPDRPSACASRFSLPSVCHPLSCAVEWVESVLSLSGVPDVSVGSSDLARSEGEESSERGVDCLDASFTRPAVWSPSGWCAWGRSGGCSEDKSSVGEGLGGWECLGLSLWTLSRGTVDQERSEWEIKGGESDEG